MVYEGTLDTLVKKKNCNCNRYNYYLSFEIKTKEN